jgi:hypothetical protein
LRGSAPVIGGEVTINPPLGTRRAGLLGVYGSLDSHTGHKMEAKGFLVKDPGGDRVNVVALEMVAPGCAAQ